MEGLAKNRSRHLPELRLAAADRYVVALEQASSLSCLTLAPMMSSKNKVEKCGMFLTAAQRQFSHHGLPAFHHVLTIKKPCSTTRFFQNPPQKHQQRENPTPSPAQDFF
jgi:hypothetical protein